jgi:Flp pilus assembly pilin Flp
MKLLNQLWSDEAGFVISAELVLVLTLAVLAMIVGLSEVAVSVNSELNDISNAIGSINQTFEFTGFRGGHHRGGTKAMLAGSCFYDTPDECDMNSSCQLIVGAGNNSGGG